MLLKLAGQVCAMTIKKPLAINQPEVGQFLRELRLALGLTQEQFAISLGVKYSTINRWKKIEKGQLYNPAAELEKIDGSKCLIMHAKDDDVVSIKPLKPFIEKTGTKLNLVRTGGHLGMAVLEKRFYKKCMKFIKSK